MKDYRLSELQFICAEVDGDCDECEMDTRECNAVFFVRPKEIIIDKKEGDDDANS